MAKKQDELKYLQMPLPNGGKTYKMIKVEWNGLNRSRELDTGMLTEEMDISTKYAPYLTPSEVPEQYFKTSKLTPISMFGFDDFLCLIYIKNSKVWVDYIRDGEPFTGLVSDTLDFGDEVLRSMVQFNVYDTVTDPVSGNYRRRLLIFPDRAAMPMYIYGAELALTSAKDEDGNTFYYAEYDDACAAVQRLEYGVMIHCGGKWYEYLDIVTDETNYGKCKFKLNSSESYFKCDGMNVTVRTYSKAPDDDIIKGIENLTDDEKNAKLEEYALSSAPDKTANTNYYYYNAATRETWRYVEVENEDGGSKWDWRVSTPPSVPALKYATVHLSRVFGVDDVRVYASGFNDYCNWTLDTINSYNEANAWVSASQASSKADGIFTGIVTYEGHVVCFKRDYMQEIYNTKNPFRINEIFAEGAIDFRTIQEVDGKLFFVSGDNVKIYTGSNPRAVGSELNINEYTYAVMQVFLYDIGEGKVEPIEKKTVSKISDSEAREYDYFIEKLGKDAFDEMRTNPGESPIKARKEWFNKYGEKFDNTLREYLSERFGFSEEQTDNVVNAETTASKSKKAIKIRNYMMNGKETVSTEYDYSATADAIKKLAAENGFEDWVDNLLTGVEKSKGLYNGKDPYTNMGDRKSFSQLHYDVTLENIVKAMKTQGDGDMKNVSGFHGIKTLRAASAKTFKNIADIHNSEGKIKNLSEEEAQEINDRLGERLSNIINYIYSKKAHSQYENNLIEFDRIGEMLTECCELEDKSPENIKALFKNYRYDIDNKAANGIVQLLFDVTQMPVHIFEAKPGRVVSFDEIAFAAVPKGKYPELKRKLEGKGIKVKEYDPDVDGSRLDVLNSEPDVKFSVSRGIDADRGIRYNGDTYSNTNGKEGKESGNGNYSISENEGRNSNAHSAVKGRPLFRIGRGALGKRGREKYIQNLDREYDIERGVINKTVKAEFIREHAYNDDMREMESDLKALGFDKVGFFVGAGRLVHRPLSSCSAVIFKNSDTGRKEVYLRYDDGEYSPRQLAVHEIGHDIYNSRLGRKIKNIIENSIPFAERNAIMQQKRYKLYAEALEDPELVFEEFVCDVLGGMTDYSSTHFENLMNAFWNQDLEFINNYKVAEYTESIDAGGTTNNKISYSAKNDINANGGTVITANDVKAVQSIPRKSVNGFTSNEIQKTEGFARKYFNEMGTKSPFFRGWFGDWRANDTTTVNVANKKGAVRGITKNIDTGWDIQISGKVFNETRAHKQANNINARNYLEYMNSIVENAVLLDSYTVPRAKSKSANSAMMHSLYAIADIGNGREVIKLYVEELNDVNNDGTITRAYQLQNITKQQLSAKGSGNSLAQSFSTANTYTVSQLFNIVKRADANC